MNKFLVYILISFFVLSCNDIDKPKKPDNLISKGKMIDIITDISLMNAAKGVDKNLLNTKGIDPEKYIFQKFAIDSIQFAENSNYYAYDVKEYEDIYLQVKQRLESQRVIYKDLEEKERKERDSVRKAKKKKRDSIKGKKLLKEPKPINLLKKDRKPQQ